LRLNEIQIAGNRVTKKNVILRELRLRPGDIYDPRKISRIRSRLTKLGYFQQVEEPQVFWTQGEEGGLLLRVVEGTASRFDGLLGYVPASGSQKGYFTGLLDIALGNLLGTGRALEAHWQKRDQKTQDIKLAYWEPWIAGWPVSAGVSFSQLIQDTVYVQREFGIQFSAPLLENLAIIGQLASVSISPDSIGSYVQGLLRSRTLTASIGVEYDSRDDRINPRHGVYYSTSVQAGKKKNLGPSEVIALQEEKDLINNKRIFLDLEWYLPP
jgi:outer membrane protein assembly factor BamA